jgi:hypothetical protein
MAFVPATATVPKPPALAIQQLITAVTSGSATPSAPTATSLPTTATTAPTTPTTAAK